MPHDYSYTEIESADGLIKEVTFMPSTLETVDRALYNYIDKELDLHANTNKGWKKIPVIWVSAERSFQIKSDKDLRDSTGILKLPLITIERSSVEKDPNFKGAFQAHIPDTAKGLRRVRRLNVPAARRIGQLKTSNFKNAHSARRYGNVNNTDVGHGQVNFPGPKTDPSRVVFETIYQPIPVYVKVMYSVKARAEYLQQMNDIFQPFVTKTGQINNFFISHEGHRFEGFIEGSFGQANNVASLDEEERTYETEINLRILGYLMGEGPNDARPKMTITENAVDVKIPRERVIAGDINTFLDTARYNEGEGFYRE
jgi:hypothetical protein